jgi:Phasin protein
MAQNTSRDTQSPFDFQSAFEMNRKNLETASVMNQKLYEALRVYNEELVKFGSIRLKEDFDIPQQLSECKTAQDFVTVYTDFFQTALKQYSDEANALAKIYSQATGETFESIKQQADSALLAESESAKTENRTK